MPLIFVGKTFADYWISICRREANWISKFATPRDENDPLRQMDSQEDPGSHVDLLQRCITLAPYLQTTASAAAPVLWHHDVNTSNILISSDENPKIISILDWQNVSIGPLYLQFNDPEFVSIDFVRPDEHETSHVYQRPLESNETEIANETVLLNQHYRQILSSHAPSVSYALDVPFRETLGILILDSARSWEKRKGIVFLRQGLINIWRNWKDYGLSGQAPIAFTPKELETHLEDGRGMDGNRDFIWGIVHHIGMGSTGEVRPDTFEEKNQEYKGIKQRWIEDMNQQVEQSGCTEKIDWELYWPFRYPDIGF